MKRLILMLTLVTMLITVPVLAQSYNVYTLEDNGKTVIAHEDDILMLDLGTLYYWTVTVDDPNIVSSIEIPFRWPELDISGKYLFIALHTGSVTVTATGDPKCRQSRPACAIPSRMFELYIDVVPK